MKTAEPLGVLTFIDMCAQLVLNPNPLNVGYLFSNKISTEKLNSNFMFDFCQIL